MNWIGIRTVFYRQYLSWRTNWRTFLLLRVVEPMIFYYGIGLGIGRFVPTYGQHNYLTFLLPGSICLTLLFMGLFEGTYNAFSRAYMQRTWFSFLATPTSITDIMLGEMLFCAVKSSLSVVMLLGVGRLLGAQLSWGGALLSLPFLLLTLLAVASLGYLLMSFANSMNDFDYVWAFLMTPMMVFSGVMVDTSTFPMVVQVISWFLPLTHALKIVRPLMLGEAEFLSIVMHGLFLLGLMLGCFWLALCNLERKMQA